jgi:hypothetical protein
MPAVAARYFHNGIRQPVAGEPGAVPKNLRDQAFFTGRQFSPSATTRQGESAVLNAFTGTDRGLFRSVLGP